MDNNINPWYYLEWFMPYTLRAFSWENKIFLYILIALPVLFLMRWFAGYRFNQKLPVAVTQKDLRVSAVNLVRFVPEIFLMLVLMLVLTALARPQLSNEKVEQWTEGIDIMLALDISRSMEMEDFTPNRLEAAKRVALQFVEGRVQDRIGIVVFAGDAFSLSPLTTDYELLKSYLKDISFDMIETPRTAIGSAMAVVTNRMRESESKSKVCILLSDGENTGGNIDPITAAELAAAYNIKIYTIIVGREGRVPMGKDFFGNTQYFENTVNESTMRKLADIGGGEFFRATDQKALTSVFSKIDQYEKAEIKETRFKDTSDFYWIYLQWAVAFFLMWLMLKSTFMSNVLQD